MVECLLMGRILPQFLARKRERQKDVTILYMKRNITECSKSILDFQFNFTVTTLNMEQSQVMNISDKKSELIK